MYDRRGSFVRILYLAISAVYWLVTAMLRRGCPPFVTLYYHGVHPGQRRRFRRQMTAIADRAIGPDQIEATVGARAWPPRVCVTFDDAMTSAHDVALPTLRRLGIPCAVFAVAKRLGARPTWPVDALRGGAPEITMTEAELRRAARQPGCTIGSHAASHRPLTAMLLPDARRELAVSRNVLEGVIGAPVRDFAFPHGACDAALLEAAFEAGYHRLFTLSPAPLTRERPDRLVIGRMKMTPDVWRLEFRLTVAGVRIEVRAGQRSWLGKRRYDLLSDGETINRGLRSEEVLPYLEWAINWRLITGGTRYLLVHAASMAREGRGVLFAGSSGAGKSTLVAGLLRRGWQYLCDEFALVDPETLCLHPFPKAICVKASAFDLIERLELPLAGNRHYVKALKGTVGYITPADFTGAGIAPPTPLHAVVRLAYTGPGEPRLRKLAGGRAAFGLLGLTVNRDAFGTEAVDVIGRMVHQSKCFGLESGDLDESCTLLEGVL